MSNNIEELDRMVEKLKSTIKQSEDILKKSNSMIFENINDDDRKEFDKYNAVVTNAMELAKSGDISGAQELIKNMSDGCKNNK